MKIRCSNLGKLMTASRSKGELLSETAKRMIEDMFKDDVYGIYKDFSSRYTDKGIRMEDQAIQFASDVLGWDFGTFKNEDSYSNEYFTGTPDINTDVLLADIKCSWSGDTFPFFATEIPNKDYLFQLQGYMALTGKDTSELVYCLMNTPMDMVEDEVRRAHWKYHLMEEDLELRDVIQKQHNFDHIPKEKRIKRFIIERDDKVITAMQEKVEIAREYYNSLFD